MVMPLFYLRTSSTYWSPPRGTRKRSGRSDSIRSKGFEKDHGFNVRWLREARRVLKPDGTLWVSGTHHIIFSLGFALQSLGFKVINQIHPPAPLGYCEALSLAHPALEVLKQLPLLVCVIVPVV
jgi:hypothetical protein